MFSACGRLLMVLCAIFLQLTTVLSIPTLMQQTEATRANLICCTSPDLRSFLLGIWGILQTTKWHEINTFEWVHFYFLYPWSAHLHETGTGSLIVINLEYFVASRQWPFFFQLPSKDDRYGRDHIYNAKTNVCYFLWESTNIVLSALFADSIVRDYNLHMGGVDLSEMRTYIFLDERRTIPWNKKVFFTLFGRLLRNSFIFYQRKGDLPKLGRQKFMVKVVEGLIGGFREQHNRPEPKIKDAPNRWFNPEKHFKQTKLKNGEKKNCVVCTKLQDNICICTSYICGECNVALCIGYCWEKYHTKKVLWPLIKLSLLDIIITVFLYYYFEYSRNMMVK